MLDHRPAHSGHPGPVPKPGRRSRLIFSRRRSKILRYSIACALATLVLLNPVWSSSIHSPSLPKAYRDQLFVSPAGEPFRATGTFDYPVEIWFSNADADGDGELSTDELWYDAKRFFALLDIDHDGALDAKEVWRYETDLLPEISPDAPAPFARNSAEVRPPAFSAEQAADEPAKAKSGHHALPERTGASLFSLIDIPHPLRLADVNLDGRTTSTELAASAVRQIGYLDRNLDHKLTRAELPETPSQKKREEKMLFQ